MVSGIQYYFLLTSVLRRMQRFIVCHETATRATGCKKVLPHGRGQQPQQRAEKPNGRVDSGGADTQLEFGHEGTSLRTLRHRGRIMMDTSWQKYAWQS